MKLVSYLKDEQDQLAILVEGLLYDMEWIHPDLPNNMTMFLNYWSELLQMAKMGELAIADGHISRERGIPIDSVRVIAPLPLLPLIKTEEQ